MSASWNAHPNRAALEPLLALTTKRPRHLGSQLLSPIGAIGCRSPIWNILSGKDQGEPEEMRLSWVLKEALGI